MKMPSLKFTPRNLEKLGIILMILLLVFRPGFIKKFSNNLIGKILLLGGIVSVASHNKMYGLLAAFTYVVCVEMSSEGVDEEKEDAAERETIPVGSDAAERETIPVGTNASLCNTNWGEYLKPYNLVYIPSEIPLGIDMSACCVPINSVIKNITETMSKQKVSPALAVDKYNSSNNPKLELCQTAILSSIGSTQKL